MNKRILSLVFAVVLVFGSTLALFTPRNAARAQVVITLILPTATRTPTPINVGNFVWDDLDQDGTQDAGEPGLAGITVQLWNGAKTQLIDSTITNASGNYTLVAPTPGDYRVRVLLSGVGDLFTSKDANANDQTDSDVNPTGVNAGFTDIYSFASNLISITTIDTGIIKFRTPTPTRTPTPINLGNFVWHDLNGNGIQDSGEPGVGGVTMQLWNDAKTQLIDSTTTNSNGNYTLVAPVPGDYRIRVLLPAGASFAPANQGANDLIDSDILTTLPNLGFTNTITIASNVISITNLDAGLINVQPTATPSITNTGAAPSATVTPSATPVPSGTVQPAVEHRVFMPVIQQ